MGKKGSNKILAGALLAAAGFWVYENFNIETEEYPIVSRKIPKSFDGFRILQLSDFHNKKFGFENRYLYHKIMECDPDIIIMTGDMVSRENVVLTPFYDLCKTLAAEYPVYYTVGNHELDIDDDELHEMFFRLRKYGVHLLNNEKATLTRGGSEIDLYGMWYDLRYYKDDRGNYRHHLEFDLDEMLRLVGEKVSRNYTMLLAHNPMDFPVYAEWGADLTFSGHVHGGVVRLGRRGGLLSPGRRLFPQYFAGEYKIKNRRMLVSRGIGGPRLFNRPNLVVATLRSAE